MARSPSSSSISSSYFSCIQLKIQDEVLQQLDEEGKQLDREIADREVILACLRDTFTAEVNNYLVKYFNGEEYREKVEAIRQRELKELANIDVEIELMENIRAKLEKEQADLLESAQKLERSGKIDEFQTKINKTTTIVANLTQDVKRLENELRRNKDMKSTRILC